VAFGVLFAILFQALYDLKWEWKLTFYGGLFGGVLGFLLTYFLFIKKDSTLRMDEVVKIAPPAITLAHAFGRIGCFLDGCCYGKPTDSWIGVKFPFLPEPVIPTQLIESGFLFLLTALLLVLILVFKFKYTFIVYLGSYSIFRFIIEFFRGDDRGNFLGIFSPSQVWSIFIWIIIVPFFFVLKKLVFVEKKPDEQKQDN
jgi:phosphatidylglycerol:prolipoprotein diacylglycerol transferase